MKKIETPLAPAAIGPYSQAVSANGMIFASGQLGIDPATGEFAVGVEAQTRRALENIKAILGVTGETLADVVKATVYLADMNDFAAVNAVYAEYFSNNEILPARCAVQVARLPKDGLVEIEVIAVDNEEYSY